MKKIIEIIFVSLLLSGLANAASSDDTFNVTTVNGKKLKLEGTPKGLVVDEYKGKIVFVEFWGTWCAPCLMSIPHHVNLQEKYKDQLRVIAFETTPKETTENLKKYVADPGKYLDMSRIDWYLDNKAKDPAQKKSLEEPIKALKEFKKSGKKINYDVVSSADAGDFVKYIGQRAGWEGYIPFLMIFDGNGDAAAMVPGMPSEEKLEGIIQKILSKKSGQKDKNSTKK